MMMKNWDFWSRSVVAVPDAFIAAATGEARKRIRPHAGGLGTSLESACAAGSRGLDPGIRAAFGSAGRVFCSPPAAVPQR